MDPFQLVLLRSTPTMQGNHVGEAQLAHPRERASCQVHQGEGDMGRVMPTMASAPGPPSPSEQGKRSEVDLLLPAPQFLQRLREERSRSDRSGRPFSLVLIPAPATGQPEEEVDLFYRAIQALARTVRLSDILGWYQGDRIGLILPDTSEAQAWQVVDRLAGSRSPCAPPGGQRPCPSSNTPRHWRRACGPGTGPTGTGQAGRPEGPAARQQGMSASCSSGRPTSRPDPGGEGNGVAWTASPGGPWIWSWHRWVWSSPPPCPLHPEEAREGGAGVHLPQVQDHAPQLRSNRPPGVCDPSDPEPGRRFRDER